jgi:hypothetical protein
MPTLLANVPTMFFWFKAARQQNGQEGYKEEAMIDQQTQRTQRW